MSELKESAHGLMTLAENLDSILNQPAPKAHALTVDVEDWFQVWALSSAIERKDWDQFELRVEDTITRILDLFAEKNAYATFFVLGWVAEKKPNLIRKIIEQGHEVASHGYDHVKVFDQDATTFREDVVKTKKILEDIGGQGVTGYRAAGFSIDRRTPFAYDVLAETGHTYSSSSHPISHDHYGDPSAPLLPHKVSNELVEIPVAVSELWGRRWSCAGGGWFRAMPYSISRSMWNRLERENRSGVFYFHPWEIDPGQPKVDGISLKSKLRHRMNLGRMEAKVGRLLDDFHWNRMDRVFEDQIANNTILESHT